MRVRRSRLYREQHGAVLMIVAIMMVVLLGILMLVVDLGMMLVGRRQMVQAADAAALAAAQSCASMQTVTVAHEQALQLASANVATSSETEFLAEECGTEVAGTVEVGYDNTLDLFFAPFFGIDEGTVAGGATAAWGPAGSVEAMPVMFDLSWLTGVCQAEGFFEVLPAGATEPECAFLWDNDNQDVGLGDSTWGFLSLNQWDVDPTYLCSNPGGAGESGGLKNFIGAGGFDEYLTLNYPDPTYVCAISGLVEDAWKALAARAGDILFFPVVDPAGQIPPRPETPDKYDVVGFIPLRVQEVYKVEGSPDVQGTCGPYDTGPVTNGTQIDLAQWGASQGCFEEPLKEIDQIQVKKAGGGGPDLGSWTYDAATFTLTWTGPAEPGLSIKFHWTKSGTANCGMQVSTNSSGVCVIMSWPGPQLGGSGPILNDAPGAAFGLQAFELVE